MNGSVVAPSGLANSAYKPIPRAKNGRLAIVPPAPLSEHKQSLIYLGNQKINAGWNVDTLCLKDKPSLLVYGVGAGEDISWDTGLIDQFGATVYLFDPTEKSNRYTDPIVARYPQQLYSTKEGLSNKKAVLTFALPANPNHVSMREVELADARMTRQVQAQVNTLQNWMTERSHTYLDILKIDIEGSEYDVLEALIEQDFLPFTQLLVEFHNRMLPVAERSRHTDILQALQAKGFAPLWSIHGGQEQGFVKLADLAYCADGVSPRSQHFVATDASLAL